MMYICNKVNKVLKLGLLLCLLALLPLQAYADYGIKGDNTWHQQYLAKIANGELSPRSSNLDDCFQKEVRNNKWHYLINNVWDLCRLADIVNGGYEGNPGGINVAKEYFLLNADIDLDGAAWYPIGVKDAACFAGYFDGNGHTIQHMNITIGDVDELYVHYNYGLFGCMKGVVRDLNMTDAQVTVSQTEYNAQSLFTIGLLCGYAGCAIEHLTSGASGAVWRCNVAGEINGRVEVALEYYTNNSIGGLIGKVSSPVSIYQCHVNVSIQLSNCGSVGGIVGYIENRIDKNGYDGNTDTTPKVSYLFDCTADVQMSLSSFQTEVTCGGICGYNDGCNIVACASSGYISCSAPSSDNSSIGGIAGYNTQTIMDCVSLASIKTAYTAGGIVGKNRFVNNYSRMAASMVNCVYSGYIYSGHAHGIVGELDVQEPVNCLFLGTLRIDTPVAPLWNGDGENTYNYCDQNLYDDWYVRGEYRSFSALTSGDTEKTPFLNNADVYVGWKERLYETEMSVPYGAGSEWQYKSGFYPRIQVGSTNITNGTKTELRDYHIDRATYIMAESSAAIAALHTPKLFPAYAWLASVPAGIHNGLVTHHFDDVLSLTAKEQDMEMIGDEVKVNIAQFSLPADQTLLTVSGETATPKENVQGGVVLTVTSSDKISKQFYLNVDTGRKWDLKTARTFDAGSGTAENPYIIHNARQLMSVFLGNQAGQYYKLKKDIWFNENLLTTDGGISDTDAQWDHESNTDKNHWKAHLNGDGHLVHGLLSTNAYGLVEAVENGASIENIGFVDCAVRKAEGYKDTGFLTPRLGSNSLVSNCLFDGLVLSPVAMGSFADFGGICNKLDGTAGGSIIEDCVVAVTVKGFIPYHALFGPTTGSLSTFRRILVLNNSQTYAELVSGNIPYTDCHFPAGYLHTSENAKAVSEMTNGTFFSGDGFGKWTTKLGRFPMLKSFAETAYGKLLSLPVYTTLDNRFENMNYLLDFTPGTATWQSTDVTAMNVDTDIRALEPKKALSSFYLVRSLDGARIITPITTDESLTAGIKFKDIETKKFCLAHYDSNGDGAVTLSELKSVTLDQFQQDMTEDDGNPYDNDGELITTFPEFRYFAGITDLGTSFHDKDNLQTVEFSGNITELSDDDFKGNTSMTRFTIPTGITSVSGKAFHNSGLENFSVEVDHTAFAAADGVLFNKNQDHLVSFPNGRKDASITIPDNVKTIASNAVYKMAELESVYIDAADYDYETVIQLGDNAFTAADGKEITYYVEDATQDYANSDDEEEEEEPESAPSHLKRRTGNQDKPEATDGKGKGHLVSKYQESDFWVGKKIEPFFKLQVSDKSRDAEGNYWATMYIGFDTQLPEGLTPYTVKMKDGNSKTTLVLKKIKDRKVPMLTPVVVMAKEPGEYKLLSSNEPKYKSIPMYENILDGVKRDGMTVNQSDSNDGGCLTLGRNKSGKIGFFIYKGKEKIPAFRAYVSVNIIGEARDLLLDTEGETTNIQEIEGLRNGEKETLEGDETFFDLKGQHREQPVRGLNITKGRLFIKK